MIGNLFYLCPSCLAEDSLTDKRGLISCSNCHESFPFKNKHICYDNNEYSVSQFYQLIRSSLNLRNDQSINYLRASKNAKLRQGIKKVIYSNRNKSQTIIESPVEVDNGKLVLTSDSLLFRGNTKDWIFPKNKIIGFTTNSKYFEFKILNLPFFQIFFEEESPLKYEDLFTDWFQDGSDTKSMIEHQPRITYRPPDNPSLVLKKTDITNWNSRERFSVTEFFLHIFIGLPIVYFLKWYSDLTFSNEHLIPENGPFILLMNHESYLDPIIISTIFFTN